jgi:hypothetical protein
LQSGNHIPGRLCVTQRGGKMQFHYQFTFVIRRQRKLLLSVFAGIIVTVLRILQRRQI